ncbi:DUF7697 family protein [Salipiger pallidus]|uniref:DUF7697 family protein n=1 Tax=Salipiger pallidus TaxID=1775170 RepID=UPI004032AACC
MRRLPDHARLFLREVRGRGHLSRRHARTAERRGPRHCRHRCQSGASAWHRARRLRWARHACLAMTEAQGIPTSVAALLLPFWELGLLQALNRNRETEGKS